MSRRVRGIDRGATLVASLLALGLGVLAILWWTGTWAALPEQVNASAVTDALDQPWWPWAAGAGGLALVLIGLGWLSDHLRSQSVGRLALPGSGTSGRLNADAGPVAKAAGEAFGAVRGVRSSRATISHDRGQMVARVTATVDPEADLDIIASAADRVSAELRQVLGRDDVLCRVQLKVSGKNSTLSRVS